MGRAIIVRGELVPCDADVLTWRESGLLIVAPSRKVTRAVVNHWTGAENSPELLYRNLVASRKSVHFAIDAAGIVWQFCDAESFCAHAKGANAWAVGIEIVNRADSRAQNLIVQEGPGRRTYGKLGRGVVRELLEEEIHGKRVRYRAFTPEQVRSAIALNVALCSAYGLPLSVPLRDHDVAATVLPQHELRKYRGVLGHLHLKESKRDPGLALLRALQAHASAMGAGTDSVS